MRIFLRKSVSVLLQSFSPGRILWAATRPHAATRIPFRSYRRSLPRHVFAWHFRETLQELFGLLFPDFEFPFHGGDFTLGTPPALSGPHPKHSTPISYPDADRLIRYWLDIRRLRVLHKARRLWEYCRPRSKNQSREPRRPLV